MSIGDPIPRIDGPDKVRGRARYTGDISIDGLLYAVIVGAPMPSGTIESIDSRAALASPGVVRVITAADMPRFAKVPVPPTAMSKQPMQDGVIRYEGEPVAIVVAATLEQAEYAAKLVKPKIAGAPFAAQGAGEIREPSKESGYAPQEAVFKKGDADQALSSSAHRQVAEYTQPSRHHNPMEPSATIAFWEDDELTMYDSVQHGYGVQFSLAAALSIPPEKIRVICHHTGGGFGCKGYVWPHQILSAVTARLIGKPIKLVLTRSQMYSSVGYQAYMRHEMALAADTHGKLTAVKHVTTNVSPLSDDFVEMATEASRGMYATATMHLVQQVERANVNMPTALRAPWEGPGLWGLESAADELAHTLGQDPLDFRLANYAEVDPAQGRPWSSKKLREAYEEGARLFGWRERPRKPVRDGHWLIGHGMASCSMGCFRMPSEARVRLKRDGTAVIETGTHDIGTGSVTIFPQIAADVLGLPVEKVTLLMGDTRLPRAGPSYGSSSTLGVGSAVAQAAENAKRKRSELENGAEEVVGEGRFALPNNAQFSADGSGTPYAMRTFGAVFVEVGVDADLGLLRLRRVVGSYSAGRIINRRTAHAQITGGIIWGWGMAAMEASVYEPRLGRWLSKNLSGVAIPVNADIPADIQVHFADEFDPHAGTLGAKGIGELGATGVAAAVANAVFAATGKRIRHLPITPEKLLT
jgi:xanthine dehydrogenase YagR molybdenum-binding subunit